MVPTWHTQIRQAIEFIEATFPVDLAQVVARAGVGVARMNNLFDDVVAEGTGGWRENGEKKNVNQD